MSLLQKLFRPGKKSVRGQFRILEPAAYRSAIRASDVQLIDVRTSGEYRSGHLPGAVNLDFFQRKAFVREAEGLIKKEPVYVYCRSGNRSRKAAKLLLDLDFVEVVDLKGGILNWNA